MKKARKLLKKMMISSAVWTVLVAVVLLLLSGGRLSMLTGSILGGATAILLLWHMFHHLDIALDLQPKSATRHMQVAAVQRVAIMAVALTISMCFYQYAHPVGTVLAMFGMKVSAFVQPVLQKRGQPTA